MDFYAVRLAIISISPVVALIIGLYLTDRYDREPVSLLSRVFLLGFLSSVPVLLAEILISQLNIFPGIFGVLFTSFIVAGLTEEYFKRLVVLKTAYLHASFNEKLDGIIYCCFSALGFATIENIMYIFTYHTSNPFVGLYRGVFSVPGHMLFAVTMGYYLSLAKYSRNPKNKNSYCRKSLIYPVLLHGTFNFILMTEMSVVFMFIPFVFFLWYINLRKLNHFYKESKQTYS